MTQQIASLAELQAYHKKSESVWLLLAKRGSEQSDCAIENFLTATSEMKQGQFLFADVSEVRDIHPVYEIGTVPSLLEFGNGSLKNVFKGCHKPKQFKSILENAIFAAHNGEVAKPAKRVIVYSTPTCSWCTTLKRHLDVHQVRYVEIDVSKDQKAAEAMVKKSGQQGVPQTEINGQMIVGFDKNRINALLEIK